MNKLSLLLALLPINLFAQVSYDFESGTMGSFTEAIPGRWEVSADRPVSGVFSLKHAFDNSDSGNDQAGLDIRGLSLASGPASWQFRLRHGYDPSSSNNWAIFLVSDAPPQSMKPGAAVNGYAVAVNFTGYDDTLRLLKIANGTATQVINSGINWQNSIGTDSAALIRVERSVEGEWRLMMLNSGGEIITVATASDLWYPWVSWFGISYRYTSTRDRLLWFDDLTISGTWHDDINPPHRAGAGDIVITEVMADPLPAVGLPQYEYIELQNRSTSRIDLLNWKLTCNTTVTVIPPVSMAAGSRLLLCSTAAAQPLSGYGTVMPLKSFPSLPDGGSLLVLSDSAGNLIHGVEYSSSWHQPDMKRDGGWSLEMTDAGYPFAGSGNWASSVSRTGGTPGAVNSTSADNPDTDSPYVTAIFPPDSLSLNVSFSKSIVNWLTLAGSGVFEGVPVSSVVTADPLLRSFRLTFGSPLERGVIYNFLPPANLTDFSGNTALSGPVPFALPEPSQPGDLVFNEILFDPWPDEYDFVELVNVSGRCLDASRLMLLSANPATGSRSSLYPLSEIPRCILPGRYYAVTIDPRRLTRRYLTSDSLNIFAVSALPSMPDDRAIVTLYNRELDIIDRMSYDKSMHFSLLSGTEGISLEKVTPTAPSGVAGNWHSASGASGWATPGAVNSVFSTGIPNGSSVSLSGRRITPNSDGIDDLIVINFTAPSAENVVRIVVFTENGYPVRTLADNLYTGYEAIFTWNGTDDSGRLLPTGIYIIWLSAFDSNGNTRRHKEAVAVIR